MEPVGFSLLSVFVALPKITLIAKRFGAGSEHHPTNRECASARLSSLLLRGTYNRPEPRCCAHDASNNE